MTNIQRREPGSVTTRPAVRDAKAQGLTEGIRTDADSRLISAIGRLNVSEARTALEERASPSVMCTREANALVTAIYEMLAYGRTEEQRANAREIAKMLKSKGAVPNTYAEEVDIVYDGL